MEISATQFVHGAQSLQGPHKSVATKDIAPTTTRENAARDEVRFSEEALRLNETRLNEIQGGEESSIAGIRFDLVNRIKSEIASGSYDTPDKMDIALDRLIERLNPR